jgi:hypothetical protein
VVASATKRSVPLRLAALIVGKVNRPTLQKWWSFPTLTMTTMVATRVGVGRRLRRTAVAVRHGRGCCPTSLPLATPLGADRASSSQGTLSSSSETTHPHPHALRFRPVVRQLAVQVQRQRLRPKRRRSRCSRERRN